MNFNAYDTIKDKSSSDGYIDKDYKKLFLNTSKYYEFCTFLSRYDPTTNNRNLYIALLNKRQPSLRCYPNTYKHGKLIIPLINVWEEYGFDKVIVKDITNVQTTIVEQDEDGIIITISEIQ